MAHWRDDLAVHAYLFQRDAHFQQPPALPIRTDLADWPPPAVSPYRLCGECRRFCASLSHFVAPYRLSHYAAGTNIAVAAGSGCHLCSIILARLRYLPPGDSEDDRKWREDDRRPLDSVVDRPKAKHRSLRSSGYLILDLHFPSDRAAKDRLNYGSVYLRPTQGTLPPIDPPDSCKWVTSFVSPACFRQARTWLSRCRTRHADCRLSPHAPPPTRLLNLRGLQDETCIRLSSSPCGPTPQYVTLSWRWPAELPVRLLKSTIGSFSTRMYLPALPQTFQDAVHIARELGFSHLWIDALCIVQDDEASISYDIRHMDSVYGGSALTIAVGSATESHKGFLKSRWPLSNHDCWLTEEGNINLLAQADGSETADSAPGHCLLDKRGWVTQERLLSPRTLYFSDRHIFWECRTNAYHEKEDASVGSFSSFVKQTNDSDSEDNEYIIDDPMLGALKRCWTKIYNLDPSKRTDKWECTVRSSWHLIISTYTRSDLSFGKDKMRALAGAAALIQKPFNVKATFGLWHDFFLTELLWRPILSDGPFKDPKMKDRAPSWSWMKGNRHVINDWVTGLRARMTYSDYQQVAFRAEITKLPPETSFDKALCSIPNPAKFLVGMKGPLVQVEWGRDQTERPTEWRADSGYYITTAAKRRLEKSSDHEHLNRNFSADYILPDDLELWCMLVTEVKSSVKGIPDEQLGIVLEPVFGVNGWFKRVGAMHLRLEHSCAACKIFPDDAPVMEIELI